MPRFTFKKNERLCSRKDIEQLYAGGQVFYVNSFKIIFLVQKDSPVNLCQVVFSAPKKMFPRAVDRNLLKRRLREAYRLNKPVFYQELSEKNISLHLLVQYNTKNILSFEEIATNMKQAINDIVKKASR